MKKIYLLGAIFIAGCSSIKSIPIQNYSKTPIDGFPYHLTATDLTLKVVRKLQSCDNGVLTFKTTFEVKPTQVIDEAHTYVIDPKELQSWIKSTSIKLEYHPNGTLKSINSEAEDMTGELLTAIAGTAVKLVSGLPNPGSSADGNTASINLCNDNTQSLLDDVRGSKEAIKLGAAKLSIATDKVIFWTQKKKAAGKHWTREQSREFTNAIDALQKSKLDQDALSAHINQATDTLTLTHTVNLSSKNTANWFSVPIDEVTIEELTKKKWLSAPGITSIAKEECLDQVQERQSKARQANTSTQETPNDTPVNTILPECALGLSVLMQPANVPHSEIRAHINGTGPRTPTDGFVFRTPQLTSIDFTKAVLSPEDEYIAGDNIDSVQISIAQLSNLYIVPFKSYPFSKLKFGASFSESGALISIASESTSSVPKATSAFDNFISKAGEIKKIKAEEPLNELKNQTALLKAQKELEDAKKQLEPNSDDENALAALKASTAMYEAELANFKAEKALEEAMNGSATQ